jgi:hypothetical protein
MANNVVVLDLFEAIASSDCDALVRLYSEAAVTGLRRSRQQCDRNDSPVVSTARGMCCCVLCVASQIWVLGGMWPDPMRCTSISSSVQY